MEAVNEWFSQPPREPRAPQAPKPKTPTQRASANERAYRSRQKDFVPLELTFDDADGWQVCYAKLHVAAKRVAQQFRYESDRELFLRGEWRVLPWGKVHLSPCKQRDRYVSGGELWYDGPHKSNRIFDVRSFFMQSAARTFQDYSTTDVVAIMEQARDDLDSVGLRSYLSHWYRNSSIAAFLLRYMNVTGIPNIEAPAYNTSPKQYMGYTACGYVPGPIYEYDMVSAFASRLIVFPELRDYIEELDRIRRQLKGSPSEHLIKVTQAVLPGLLMSDRGSDRFHNLHLGLYARAETRRMLEQAINHVHNRGGKVLRWYIDGFYTDVDLSDHVLGVPCDGMLGHWKRTVHDYIILGDLSIFKTNLKMRDNGCTNIDWDAIRENPLSIRVDRPQVNWSTLEEETINWRLLFENGYHRCDFCGCHDNIHYTREGAARWLP
jgi:hypothetical protein